MTLRMGLAVTLLSQGCSGGSQRTSIPGVRLAISQWPQDAPRGAVSTFCAEHGLSRMTFYE